MSRRAGQRRKKPGGLRVRRYWPPGSHVCQIERCPVAQLNPGILHSLALKLQAALWYIAALPPEAELNPAIG